MKKEVLVIWGVIILAALTCALCTYQIFFNKIDAAMFRCNWDQPCSSNGQDCSDSITCQCTDLNSGLGYYKCQIHIVPNQ